MRRFRLSERQQVLLIIPLAAVALLAVWLGVLRPQLRKRAEIEHLRRQLAGSPYARYSMASLMQAAEHERELERQLEEEWARTVARLASFEDQADLRESEFGRIDYKVELFRTRLELLRRAEELGIQLVPRDLGLQETLGANDAEVRLRMLQLRTVRKLVGLALDQKIQKLRLIEPLAPEKHAVAGQVVFSEYPVRVEFDVPFVNLFVLLQAVFERHQVFVFRNLRVEAGATAQAPLRVRAVMSAILFE
jgi:hypothetical protein